MKTKVLVVEDEIIIADSICQILSDRGFSVLEPAVSFEEAMTSIELNSPDIVLLDIQLRGKKNGIDLAHELEQTYQIPFIYLTSNSDESTMNQAIGTNPSAFLIKPLRKEQVIAAIQIAMRRERFELEKNEERSASILVHNGKEYQKALLEDMLFIKSDNVYLEIHLTNDNRIVTRNTLSKFIEKLNSDFFQVHRSYIVNLSKIDRITKHVIKLENTEIPIGNKYKEAFLNRFLSQKNGTL